MALCPCVCQLDGGAACEIVSRLSKRFWFCVWIMVLRFDSGFAFDCMVEYAHHVRGDSAVQFICKKDLQLQSLLCVSHQSILQSISPNNISLKVFLTSSYHQKHLLYSWKWQRRCILQVEIP
jgi:hypothetical protein